MLPGGLHKTQIRLMICPHCTHAVSFKALTNEKIGVLDITHVLLYSYLPGQSSRQRRLPNTTAMKWSMTFDRARGDERRPQGGGAWVV